MLASTDSFSIAAAIRARWHQLLKLSWVSVENSRDSVRAEVPICRTSASISCPPGIGQHQFGGTPASRLLRQRNEYGRILCLMQFEHDEADQEIGPIGIVAAIEQRQDCLVQQPRYFYDEFGLQAP